MASGSNLLAIMPDATVKKLTAPDGFKNVPFDKTCKISQGKIFINSDRGCFMLSADLDRLTFSVQKLE